MPTDDRIERLRRSRGYGLSVARGRLVVLLCAVVTTLAKLRLAGTTAGTHDVGRFIFFAALVRKLGPINIYGKHLQSGVYNHPPLIGWFLAAVNIASSHGPSMRFLIRVPSSVADLVTAWLIFELVRNGRSVMQATVAGVSVALSPLLIVISGFHGNTDPVFVMFILLSAYLVMRKRPFWAGASAAIAISIKLVPVVALPSLAIALWKDWRRLLIATAGFFVVLAPLWGPVVTRQWAGFKQNVLEYGGLAPKKTQWGIVDFARNLHQSRLVDLLVGPGRFAAVAISALVPAYFVLKRRESLAVGVGLSLSLMLLLTTTYGTQYMAWAAAAVLLLNVWAGLAYNLTAGLLLVIVYTYWTNGFPWNLARTHAFTLAQGRLALLAWIVLFVCVVMGIRRLYVESRTGSYSFENTDDVESNEGSRDVAFGVG